MGFEPMNTVSVDASYPLFIVVGPQIALPQVLPLVL